ncbi:MAG: four helix bundle protein, partial [Patescibacteria group bacterium]
VDSDVLVVHAVRNLYKEVYLGSRKVSKRDKLGIFAKIEVVLLETFTILIEAEYAKPSVKLPILEKARTKIEIIKQLVRVTYEIGTLTENQYLRWQESLQEISRMTSRWIDYIATQNPPIK